MIRRGSKPVRNVITLVSFCTCFLYLVIPTAAQPKFEIPLEQLSRLSPTDFSKYRDLAEELSLIRQNQTAKDLTIRLYLICAAHSSGKLRRSALRGLIHSARDEKEKQKFKVLGFLTDPEFSSVLSHRPAPAKTVDNKKKQSEKQSSPREQLLEALILIRQGKSLRAKKIMENSNVQQLLKQFDNIMSLEEFNEACSMDEISNMVLYKILTIDLKLRAQGENFSGKKNANDTTELWRSLFKEKLPARLPPITFETVTEFDPSNSVFKNRVWQKPPSMF